MEKLTKLFKILNTRHGGMYGNLLYFIIDMDIIFF